MTSGQVYQIGTSAAYSTDGYGDHHHAIAVAAAAIQRQIAGQLMNWPD
jgi:hypothetical protein